MCILLAAGADGAPLRQLCDPRVGGARPRAGQGGGAPHTAQAPGALGQEKSTRKSACLPNPFLSSLSHLESLFGKTVLAKILFWPVFANGGENGNPPPQRGNGRCRAIHLPFGFDVLGLLTSSTALSFPSGLDPHSLLVGGRLLCLQFLAWL